MKKLYSFLSVVLLIMLTNLSFGQTVIWSENFEPDPGWTYTPIGANGADPNFFTVSSNEAGITPPGCGTAGGADNSLHITSVFNSAGGASYDAGGLCGVLFCPETATRAESPNISTIGQTNLTLEFDYIMGGDANDFAGVWYNDGGGWIALQNPLPQTPNGCAPQGQWTNYTIALPVSCENIANLQIGFSWVNNDDGVGTDPSFAVDDVQITTPSTGTPSVTASYTQDTPSPICEGTTVTFTDASSASNTTITTWSWNFNGGATNVTGQGPQTITFNTAGTYNIDLTVSDGTISDTYTTSLTVNATANAGADNTADVCNNGGSTTLDLNTLLSGADAGGTWTETSGTPSGQFTAGTGVFDGNGLTTNNVYTFDYTVTGSAPCPDDISTMTITIIDCSSPNVIADYTQNTTSPICEGTTVTFTDASTANATTITTWDWTFNGGDVTSANTQGPHAITFNTAGTYNIDLTVTDGTLTDTYSQSITVNAAANAGADGSSDLCNNTTLDLSTLLSGADAGGTWTETSGTPSGQFTGSTLDGNGLTIGDVFTFDYTVTGTAPCPDDISTFTITIIDCSAGTPPTANFTASQTSLCEGDCITFTDNSTPGDITAWSWDFDGGATNSTQQNPGSVCFNTAGTYNVTLTVTNPFGTNTSTATVITVNGLPNVTATASPATTLCTGDQATLTGGGATSYNWTSPVTDGVAFTPSVGSSTYTVTGTDANGCTNTASVTLTVADCVPMIAGFSFQDNICAGSCIDFTDTTSGNPVSWSWDFSTGATPISSTDQNPTGICFNTAGVYSIQLTVTDAGGTSVSTTNSITVFDNPTVSAELDTLIDLGGQADLIATSPNIGDFLWTPDTYYIDCDTCATTYAQPQLNTDYIVVFTDPNGCTAQDTVKVDVNFIEGIGVPQAFSPNGDGHNDQLVVKGFGIEKMSFKIYNRYGQLVFESDDQEHGWDGNFKGKEENPGVFVWTLEYRLLNNSSGILKGNTTLIR